jgi:hypothetical protein
MRAKRIINTECIVLSCKGCRKLPKMRAKAARVRLCRIDGKADKLMVTAAQYEKTSKDAMAVRDLAPDPAAIHVLPLL